MKTLGRILIILVTFALVMGITYVAVNAVSSSTTIRSFKEMGKVRLGRKVRNLNFPMVSDRDLPRRRS